MTNYPLIGVVRLHDRFFNLAP